MADSVTPVPMDAFISVGYFDPEFSDFNDLVLQSWEEIKATIYTEVGTGLINPVPGEWAGGGNAPGIEGRQLYVWVFGTPVVPSFVGESEFGLFTGSSSAWTGKGDGDITSPQFNFLSIESIDTAIQGSDLGQDVALAHIPEPGKMALILGFIGLVLVIVRRNP